MMLTAVVKTTGDRAGSFLLVTWLVTGARFLMTTQP